MIDEKVFWDFSNFNTFGMSVRNWALAVGFPVFMIAMGIINITIRGKASADSGLVLGLAFIALGIFYPISYYMYYKKTIREQIKKFNLSTPQNFYTCTLDAEGLNVANADSSAACSFEKMWRGYAVKEYVYLFATKKRGFILPLADVEGATPEELIAFLKQHLGKRFFDKHK